MALLTLTNLLALNFVLNILIVYVKYIQYKKENKLLAIEEKINNLNIKQKIGLFLIVLVAGAIPLLLFVLGLLFDFIPKIKISIEANGKNYQKNISKNNAEELDINFTKPSHKALDLSYKDRI